jgi:hypothetical protein
MKAPKNATEAAVDNELRRIRNSGPVAAAPCWCDACQADIRALSLSILPPYYCTTFDFDHILEKAEGGQVRTTVSQAVERVARYPKHNRRDTGTGHADLRLVNFTLEEGRALMDELSANGVAPCACQSCRTDTLAYALNRYPSKYGVERSGHIDFPESERKSIRRELSSIVAKAAGVVANQPRHS